jgi:2'-5' RNA ligase
MLIAEPDARPRDTDTVCLMVHPDAPATRKLGDLGRRLSRDLRARIRLLEEARLHTTLGLVCPFGRLGNKTLAAINEALASITMQPFLYGLDLLTNFGSERNPAVVVRGDDESTPGLTMLQDEIATTMRKIGFHIARRTPHVTLGHGCQRIPEQRVDEIRWLVQEFSLVCSLHGRHRHVPLGRWPLRSHVG